MPISLRIRSRHDADVVVVGAGPAGAATAAHLASGGAKVIVLDHARFPRDKVCGDFVGPVGLVELRHWGIPQRPEYRSSYIIRDAALYLNGRELIQSDMPHVGGLPRHGRVIPRLVLDNWLFDAARAAGAEIREGVKFLGFEADDDGVRVRGTGPGNTPCELRAKIIIGADGSSSKVALFNDTATTEKYDRIVAVRAYYSGVEVSPGRAELYFSSNSFPGYYWLFPTSKTTANVGVGMVGETIPSQTTHLRDLLLDLAETDPQFGSRIANAKLEGRIKGWPLSTYNPAQPVTGPRCLLVGDAAGLINPLNGEGIQYALLSGRWAAKFVLECLAERDFSPARLGGYDQLLRDSLGYDMALAQTIVQLIRNRDLNPVWLSSLQVITRRAKKDPEYARLAGGVLAGLLPARYALSSTMLSGTALQAVQSLAAGAVQAAIQPRRLAGLGVEAAGLGFRLAFDTVEEPLRSARWGANLTLSAVGLASHAVRDLARRALGAPELADLHGPSAPHNGSLPTARGGQKSSNPSGQRRAKAGVSVQVAMPARRNAV